MLVEATSSQVVFKDLGPWNQYKTITNDAEDFVEALHRDGMINENTRIFYYDSEDEKTELLHSNNKFTNFAFCQDK
jgi:hypothetical protein